MLTSRPPLPMLIEAVKRYGMIDRDCGSGFYAEDPDRTGFNWPSTPMEARRRGTFSRSSRSTS